MARMLGRYTTRGCWTGSRSNGRPCLPAGEDCSGWSTSTRWRKRVEQREFERSLLPAGEIDVATDVIRDCVHGCDSECLTEGNDDCTFVCHPGPLLSAMAGKRHG